jgi:hypothetical protein
MLKNRIYIYAENKIRREIRKDKQLHKLFVRMRFEQAHKLNSSRLPGLNGKLALECSVE